MSLNSKEIPKTIIELEQWMKDRCYNFVSYSINGNFVYEGNGLEFHNGAYQWCSYDRSNKRILKRFKRESQAVAYAFDKITSNTWANKNLVGIYKPDELDTVLQYLEKRNIIYETDQVPFCKDDWYTRVFVTGCDILKATDLIQKIYR